MDERARKAVEAQEKTARERLEDVQRELDVGNNARANVYASLAVYHQLCALTEFADVY